MKKNLEGLTVLRGAAALWVLLHHAYTSLEGLVYPDNEALRGALVKGWLGVDLFFILSGFIISYSNLDKVSISNFSSLRDFWLKRFARIYPAHIFVLTLFALTVSIASLLGIFSDPQGLYSTSNLALQAFLLNGIGIFEPLGWNVPSWSVSSEFLAYLLFPFLALFMKRVKSPALSLVVIAIILSINIFLALALNGASKYMLGFEFVWLRVIGEFALGMALYNIHASARVKVGPPFLVAAALTGLAFQGTVESSLFDFMYLIYFSALIFGLANISFPKRIPFFSFLGEISFSVYLIHSLIIIALNQLIRRISILQNVPEISLGVLVALSILAGWFIYRFIETPGRMATIANAPVFGRYLRRNLGFKILQ